MKDRKKEWLIPSLVCLLPVLVGAVLYPRLPETMTTHWSADGTANGWMPRAAAVCRYFCWQFIGSVCTHSNAIRSVKI